MAANNREENEFPGTAAGVIRSGESVFRGGRARHYAPVITGFNGPSVVPPLDRDRG